MYNLINRQLDLRGYSEPAPVIRTHRVIDELHDGDILLITTSDRSTLKDFYAYCALTGNELLQSTEEDNEFTFLIRKQQRLN